MQSGSPLPGGPKSPRRVPRRRSAADADDLDAVHAAEPAEEVGDARLAPCGRDLAGLTDHLDGALGDGRGGLGEGVGDEQLGQVGLDEGLVDAVAEVGRHGDVDGGVEHLEGSGHLDRGHPFLDLDATVEVVEGRDGRRQAVGDDALEDVVHHLGLAVVAVDLAGDLEGDDQGSLGEGQAHGTLHDFLSPS